MVERDFSFIHSYSTRNTPTRSFIHTNTFTAEASCTLQTHAGGELRNSQQKRMRRDPYMNSGFTTHQHANNHTKQKTFTPRTHHTRFILMLATCDVYRAHRHGSESPHPGSTPGLNGLNPCNHLTRQACGPWRTHRHNTYSTYKHVACVDMRSS